MQPVTCRSRDHDITDSMLPVEGKKLVACQRQHCKDMGLIVFGFTLQKAQVDAIYILFYKERDLCTAIGKFVVIDWLFGLLRALQ